MKNLTNQTNVSLTKWSVPHAVVFEVAIAITSVLVITTSCFVLKHIYLKERRSRADLLFIITSITDIGVGLLTVPFGGVNVACETFVKCSASIFYLINAFNFFPLFSYLVTTVIAIDRVLLITKNYKYKTVVTTARLKIIVAFLFVFSIGFVFLFVYHLTYLERHFTIYRIVVLSIMVILPLAIVVAYTCILCYVYRRSNAISHCKVSGKNNNKKITKSIMLILISQVISILPILSLHFLSVLDIFCNIINDDLDLLYILYHWFFIIENCQFFVNGLILLINQRENTRKLVIKTEDTVSLKNH